MSIGSPTGDSRRMTPEWWQQVKELFHSALEREPCQRTEFLDEACSGDEELRKEVESLIASHEKTGSFIDSPAFEAAAAQLLAEEKPELTPGQRVLRVFRRAQKTARAAAPDVATLIAGQVPASPRA
jgi:hypothetical protein